MADHHFVKATPALIADANLTDGDVRVYLAILSHADWGKLTNCYPSLKLIADTAGKRRSVVIKNIANLIEHGWLTRTQRFNGKGQTASLYGFPKQHAEAGVGAKSGLTLGAQSGHDQEPSTKHQRPKRKPRYTRRDEPQLPASIVFANAGGRQVDLVERSRLGLTSRQEEDWMHNMPAEERAEDDWF